MSKYRSKPKTIDACQWLGNNLDEVKTFLNDENYRLHPYSSGMLCISGVALGLHTTHFEKDVFLYQWIIKTTRGRVRTMEPDKFANEYEKIEE